MQMCRSLLLLLCYSAVAQLSPNIILILLDDAGYGDFQGFHISTPNLDSIGVRGVNFINGYVTAPQCSPSRVAILTGRYQQHYGHETNAEFLAALSHPRVRILPEYLPHMYQSGLFGKWNLGDLPHPPKLHGFQDAILYRHFDEIFASNTSVMLDGIPVRGREYSNTLIFQFANQFIRNKTFQEQPFFLYLAPMSPHVPHVFPPSYTKTFVSLNSSLPIGRRKVLTMMAELDVCVGSLLSTLEQLQISNNTLIFLINDNGAPTVPHSAINPNSPLRGFKGELYDGGIHVKYSLQWPSVISSHQVINTPVSTLDILPTILHLFHHRADHLDGCSLFHLLQFDRPHHFHSPETFSLSSRRFYWRFLMLCKSEKRAMRHGEMKWLRTGESVELYNMSSDPFENVNLATTLPDIVKEMEYDYFTWEGQFPPIAGRGEAKPICSPKGHRDGSNHE